MFQIIKDLETARPLSEAGLLWWSRPCAEQPWKPDSTGYWSGWRDQAAWDRERNDGLLYAVLLEE